MYRFERKSANIEITPGNKRDMGRTSFPKTIK
jgi:hypothetical protein